MSVALSVIIPVYNGEPFIVKTIKSVLAQTFIDYEIIVVDDGSTDQTLHELVQFKGLIHVISIKNGGVSNARNTGILASEGELIAFLDADDQWNSDKLTRQLSAMLAYPDVGFCCCNYISQDPFSGSFVRHFDQFKSDKKVILDSPMSSSTAENLIAKGNFVGTASNVIIKREILNKVGLFDTRFKQAEDLDLYIRCALETQFLLISDVLLEKNTHDNNLTNNLIETFLFHELVLTSLLQGKLISKNPFIEKFIYQGITKVRYLIGNEYFHRNEIKESATYFLLALRSDISIVNIYEFLVQTAKKIMLLFLQSLNLRTKRSKLPINIDTKKSD